MGRTKEEDVMIDHDGARMHEMFYITRLQNQITARGLVLNGAIGDFNDFLKLPASSSLAAAIWDAAFSALSAAIPLFKIGELVKQAHKDAEIALTMARIFSQRARMQQVKKAATKVLDVGAQVAQHLDNIKSAAEKAGEVNLSAPDTLGENVAWGPIAELIEAQTKGQELWEKVVQIEAYEWIDRVDDIDPPNPDYKGKTLLSIVKGKLPEPQIYKKDDIAQLRLFYLYNLIKAHVATNAYFDVTITEGWGQADRNEEFKGLNDTQIRQILEWFGPAAKRGAFFPVMPIFDINQFLGMAGVKVKETRLQREQRGFKQ